MPVESEAPVEWVAPEPTDADERKRQLGPIAADYEWRLDDRFDPQQTTFDEDAIEWMLAKLPPRPVTYCHARLRGVASALVCEDLGLQRKDGKLWETAPWWEPLCDRERLKLFGDPLSVFLPLVPGAVKATAEALTGKHGTRALTAAMEMVYDRVYGKPLQTQINKRDPEDDGSLAAEIVQILKATAELSASLQGQDNQKALPQDVEGERVEVVEVSSTVVADR